MDDTDKSNVCNEETNTSLKKEASFIDCDSDANIQVAPLYENVFYQNPMDESTAFPLDLPTNFLEPPKEKPPPPPVDIDPEPDELVGNGNFKHTSSARRIKKEIRNKRTSFLGLEGQVDDNYLDVDLALTPRPDIASFLQEETKIAKLLCKKTLSHDMDVKLRESRDSGVDVDRGPSLEASYKGQSSPETSNPHSRQNSEPYTYVTVTSDEEEAANKQKEQQFGTDLSSKLSDLTVTAEEMEENKIDSLNKKIQQQQEVLRFERELLQLEQEELRRQRENLLRDQTRIIQKCVQDGSTVPASPEKPPLQARATKSGDSNYGHSMPNLLVNEGYTPVAPITPESYKYIKRKPFVSEEHIQTHFGVEESRMVLYEERVKVADVQRQVLNVVRPPQPLVPPKPRSQESVEREITMRSSRVPSAVEYVNIDRTTVQLRQKPSLPAKNASNGQHHPMTRLTLQEAEQRRIEEQRSKLRANQRFPFHQDAAPPPPTLHNMHPLTSRTSSQQYLPQGYKWPSRPEVPRPEPPTEEKLLSVSGRRKCSHCGEELGRGAAMIIESLSLCYHVWCFTCAVCGTRLGDGRAGADVRVRGKRLHCHQCYSGDDGRKYSCV